jgi:type II secretory pathway pseudopilin PulG
LLMVIAVIMILAGITFGISRGVQNAQARAAVKAELATLSQAIEQFKLRYGDYPWHDSDTGNYSGSAEVTNTMLLYALTGRVAMKPEVQSDGSTKLVVSFINKDLDNVDVKNRPKFIDITKFSVQEDGSGEAIAFLDPWGNPYKYWYKWENSPNDWEVFGFHLYSLGADSAEDKSGIDEATGVVNSTYRNLDKNVDNIFLGE